MSDETPTFDLTPQAEDESDVTDTVSESDETETSDETLVSGESENPVKTEVVDTDFHYATHLDPARQVSPTGVYLDDVVRLEAEKVRAKVEGREPNLENPPATQGTPLYPKGYFNNALNTLRPDLYEPDAVLPVVVVKEQ